MEESKAVSIADSNLPEIAKNQPRLQPMIAAIGKALPELNRAREYFGKTQTQFMDNVMTLSAPTPMRNIHQILANIEQIRSALSAHHFKSRRLAVELRQLKKKLEQTITEDDAELLQIDIDEKISQQKEGEIYVSGAIRRLANYTEQYNSLIEHIKKENPGLGKFDEIDFELVEERYHIMKAFEQALGAARSHGGVIDEGNHIYFYQLGINGTAAQLEMNNYLVSEGRLVDAIGKGQMSESKMPTHADTLEFLERMAKKYKGCSSGFAKWKGMQDRTSSSLLSETKTNLSIARTLKD